MQTPRSSNVSKLEWVIDTFLSPEDCQMYMRIAPHAQVLSQKDQAENNIKSITQALDSMDPCHDA